MLAVNLCNILLPQCSETNRSLQASRTEEKPPGCFSPQCLCSEAVKGEPKVNTAWNETSLLSEKECRCFCPVLFAMNDFFFSVTCAPRWDPPGRPELYRFADSMLLTLLWSVCTAAPPDISPAVGKTKVSDRVIALWSHVSSFSQCPWLRHHWNLCQRELVSHFWVVTIIFKNAQR